MRNSTKKNVIKSNNTKNETKQLRACPTCLFLSVLFLLLKPMISIGVFVFFKLIKFKCCAN